MSKFNIFCPYLMRCGMLTNILCYKGAGTRGFVIFTKLVFYTTHITVLLSLIKEATPICKLAIYKALKTVYYALL